MPVRLWPWPPINNTPLGHHQPRTLLELPRRISHNSGVRQDYLSLPCSHAHLNPRSWTRAKTRGTTTRWTTPRSIGGLLRTSCRRGWWRGERRRDALTPALPESRKATIGIVAPCARHRHRHGANSHPALPRADDLRIIAADAAVSMLDLARLNVEIAGLRDQIQLQQADAKQMAYRDAMFDAVISNSIIHHIPEPAAALAEAVRVTKPGGLLFFRDLMRPAGRRRIGPPR